MSDPKPSERCLVCDGSGKINGPCPDGRVGCLVIHWIPCPKCAAPPKPSEPSAVGAASDDAVSDAERDAAYKRSLLTALLAIIRKVRVGEKRESDTDPTKETP